MIAAILLALVGASTGTATTHTILQSDTVLRSGTSWYVAGDGLLVKSTYAIVAEPRGVGAWRYIFHTREHGEVDLDTLLAQMDSVLSGKRRGP